MISYTTPASGDTSVALFQWDALANGDQGAPVPFAAYADRSVQVFGTFGIGGTVAIKGSNDGAHWSTLTDLQGAALVLTAERVVQVAEITRFIRPEVTAGDVNTSLSVLMLGKGR